jgi:hypothetical protein
MGSGIFRSLQDVWHICIIREWVQPKFTLGYVSEVDTSNAI